MSTIPYPLSHFQVKFGIQIMKSISVFPCLTLLSPQARRPHLFPFFPPIGTIQLTQWCSGITVGDSSSKLSCCLNNQMPDRCGVGYEFFSMEYTHDRKSSCSTLCAAHKSLKCVVPQPSRDHFTFAGLNNPT